MQDLGFYDDAITAAADRHGIPASWLKAFIGTETSFEIPAPRTWEPAVKEYSYGPLQILLSTARDIRPGLTAAELENPETNIDVGAAFMRTLADRYGSFERVYSAYNSGNPDRWTNPASTTAAGVDRARRWLQQFAGEIAPDDFSAFFLVIAAAAFWWWKKGGRWN